MMLQHVSIRTFYTNIGWLDCWGVGREVGVAWIGYQIGWERRSETREAAWKYGSTLLDPQWQ